MTRSLLLVTLCLALAAPRAAADESAEVQALIDRAQVEFKEARYAEALDDYRAALRAGAPPALAFMVGRCHQRLERWHEASVVFRLLAGDASMPDDVRERARSELAAIDARLAAATLVLDVRPAGARVIVDGRPVGTAPLAPLVLAPGQHQLRVVAADHDPVDLPLDLVGGATHTRAVELSRRGVATPASEPAPPRAPPPAPEPGWSDESLLPGGHEATPKAAAWIGWDTFGISAGGLLVVGGVLPWAAILADVSPPGAASSEDPRGITIAGISLGAAAAAATLLHYWLADAPAEPAPQPWNAPAFELGVGVLGGGGFADWSTPSHTTQEIPGTGEMFDIPFFAAERVGARYGIGLTIEARLWGYLGLEIDVMLGWAFFGESTTWTYTEINTGTGDIARFETRSRESFTARTVRLPLLVKGILPIHGPTRLFLGFGPELAFGTSASAEFEQLGPDPLKGPRARFMALTAAHPDLDVCLTTALGVETDFGPVRLSTQFRLTYDLSQPSDYYERIHYEGELPWQTGNPGDHPTHGTIRARDTFTTQLYLSAQYVF